MQPVIAQAADPVPFKLCGAISVLCLWRGGEEESELLGEARQSPLDRETSREIPSPAKHAE